VLHCKGLSLRRDNSVLQCKTNHRRRKPNERFEIQITEQPTLALRARVELRNAAGR
jgi:hypothetical protein